MRRTCVVLIAVVLVALPGLLTEAGAGQVGAEMPSLTVLNTANEAIREIQVDIAAGATQGDAIVNVRNDGNSDATFGLRAAIAGFDATVSGATGPSIDTFKLRPGQVVGVRVTVAGVTDNATHQGQLLVQPDSGGLSQLIPIRVQRAGGPTDVLVEGSTAEGITRTVSGADFRDVITLVSPAQTEVKGSLRLTDLLGPDGQTYSLEALHSGANARGELAFSAPYDITLRATLLRPGEYRATMTLTVGAKQLPIAIKLVRTPEALVLTVAEPRVPSVQAAGRASTDLEIVVTSAVPVNLRRPQLQLKRGGDDVSFRAVVSVEGREIGSTQSIPLVSNVPTTVSVSIRELAHPGAYTGTVSFQADGLAGAAEKAFAFGVARPPLLAFGVIAAGVVISLLISSVLVRRKQNLAAAFAAVPLSYDLEALGKLPLTPKDAVLYETLRARLADARARSEAGDAPEERPYDGISVRLKLLRRVVLVQDRMASVDEVTRSTVEFSLAAVRDFIASAEGDTVPATVDQAMQDAEQMTGVLPGLRAQVADIERRLTGREPMFDAERVKEIKTSLKSLVGDAPTAASYTLAVQHVRPLLIDLYRETLKGQASMVPAHPPVDWASRQAAILAEAAKINHTRSVAEADAHLDRGYALLLVALIDGLEAAAPSEKVKRLLGEARTSVQLNNLMAAKASFDSAVKQYNSDVEKAAGTRRARGVDGLLGSEDNDTAEVPQKTLEAPAYSEVGPGEGSTTPSAPQSASQKIANELKWVRGITAVVIGIVATVVGFGLLYVDSPTWGSLKDVVAAFVWGLGLSGTSYAGAAAVSSNLLGSKTGS